MASRFTDATRLVWSRTVDAAHVGRFVSSHASSASATVCAESDEGGDNVSAAATFCASRLVPRTVLLTCRNSIKWTENPI